MNKAPQKSESIFNLATYITLSRFFLVPVFIYYFLVGRFALALIILIIASITDITDGLLARKFNMGTKLGSVLDPLADKFLMLISFLVLSTNDILPWWLALIVIGRDFYIVFGMMYLYFVKRLKFAIKPSRLSKSTTLFQFLLLTFSFIKVYLLARPDALNLFYRGLSYNIQFALIYIAGLFTIATFIQYTCIAIKIIKRGEKREDVVV